MPQDNGVPLSDLGARYRERSFGEKLGDTWPARAARAIYEAVTLPGDVYAGRTDPMSDEGIGRAAELGGLVMGGTFAGAPAAKAGEEILGAGFVRRSQKPHTPDNGVGYSMFKRVDDRALNQQQAVQETADLLRGYGPYAWHVTDDGAVHVADLQKDIVRALREAGVHEEYGWTAAKLARTANPSNIVDSAGIWDSPNIVEEIWNRVLEPKNITKVKTDDGLLLFDQSLASRLYDLP